jgi:hypothetical protein
VLPEAALFRLGRFPFPLSLPRTSAHRLTLRQMSSFTHERRRNAPARVGNFYFLKWKKR